MEQSLIINPSAQDLDWIKLNLPGLSLVEEDGLFYLRGVIDFSLFYHPETEELISNPSDALIGHKYHIRDAYQVEVKFERNKNSLLPQVREIGGRITEFATKTRTMDLKDLHIQPNGSLCLCARQEEARRMPKGLNFEVLFFDLVYPFFYSHSYYERKGQRPWKDLSHGALGILEYHFRAPEHKNLELVESTLRALPEDENIWPKVRNYLENIPKPANSKCLCGSGRKFTSCRHQEALGGLLKLKEEIAYFDSLEA